MIIIAHQLEKDSQKVIPITVFLCVYQYICEVDIPILTGIEQIIKSL